MRISDKDRSLRARVGCRRHRDPGCGHGGQWGGGRPGSPQGPGFVTLTETPNLQQLSSSTRFPDNVPIASPPPPPPRDNPGWFTRYTLHLSARKKANDSFYLFPRREPRGKFSPCPGGFGRGRSGGKELRNQAPSRSRQPVRSEAPGEMLQPTVGLRLVS